MLPADAFCLRRERERDVVQRHVTHATFRHDVYVG